MRTAIAIVAAVALCGACAGEEAGTGTGTGSGSGVGSGSGSGTGSGTGTGTGSGTGSGTGTGSGSEGSGSGSGAALTEMGAPYVTHELAVGAAPFVSRRARFFVPREPPPASGWPLLIVLDGQAAFEEFSLEGPLDVLARHRTIARWTVLAVDSTEDRERELASEPERFGAQILDQLLPAASAIAPISSDRAQRAVLGFSYGGLAAVRIQLARPDDVGRVVAMSPSVWWRRTELVGRFRDARGALPQRLWIDVGTAEGPGVVPGMVRGARALRQVARERGLVLGRELGYLEEPGATHGMEAVAARALAALAFTLSDVDLHDDTPDSIAIHVAPSRRDLRRTTFSVSALYREGSYRLTLPPELVTLSAPASVALEGATLRVVPGAVLRAEHRGRVAELSL